LAFKSRLIRYQSYELPLNQVVGLFENGLGLGLEVVTGASVGLGLELGPKVGSADTDIGSSVGFAVKLVGLREGTAIVGLSELTDG